MRVRVTYEYDVSLATRREPNVTEKAAAYLNEMRELSTFEALKFITTWEAPVLEGLLKIPTNSTIKVEECSRYAMEGEAR